jgi:hypothetical protein
MGGKRRPVEAAILKGLGATAGIPDILLWHDGNAFALELKSETGALSDAQITMLARLGNAGVHTAVAYGLDEALRALAGWNLLRGRTA